MRQTSETQVLTMYGIFFCIMEYLFSIILGFLIVFGEVISSTIIFILLPLISCIVSCKIAFKNKKVVTTSAFNRNLIIMVTISYVISYLLIFNLDVFSFVTQAIMFIFVYKYVKKSINKVLVSDVNDSGLNQEIMSDDGEVLNERFANDTFSGSLIKDYKLEKFDDENISNFLTMNNLNQADYVFATIGQNTATILMLSPQASALTMRNCIIAFDENRLYIFELSRLSDKKIVNAYTIERRDINKFSDTKLFSSHTITIVCKDKDMYIINLSAKAKGISDHKEKIERLIEMYRFVNV